MNHSIALQERQDNLEDPLEKEADKIQAEMDNITAIKKLCLSDMASSGDTGVPRENLIRVYADTLDSFANEQARGLLPKKEREFILEQLTNLTHRIAVFAPTFQDQLTIDISIVCDSAAYKMEKIYE